MIKHILRLLKNMVFQQSHPEEGRKSRRRISCGSVQDKRSQGFCSGLIFRISLGVVLILLGVVGIFLPIMPGLLLILLGSAVIVEKNPKVLFGEIAEKVKRKMRAKEDEKAR